MSTTKILAITTGTILTLGTGVAQILNSVANYVLPLPSPELSLLSLLERVSVHDPAGIAFNYAYVLACRGKRAAEKQREKEERDQESQQKREITAAYQEIREDVYPTRPDEMENFFLTEISQAEAVVTQGPEMYVTAAKHFFRALKVYPNTPELLDIYKKTVPEQLFNLITGLRECEENDHVRPPHEAMD